MGTEIAIPVFGPLTLIGVLILMYVAISGRKRLVTESSKLGLGRSRIAFGYLGALLLLIPVAVWMTLELIHVKVARGDLTAAEAVRYQLGYSLTLYFLLVPFVVVGLTVVGLPVLALLRRFRMASLAASVAVSLILASLIALWSGEAFLDFAIIYGSVAAGFALAARLPLLRSAARQLTIVGADRDNEVR